MGLDLAPADNAVESGIYDTWTLLSAGKLKAFASCQDWISEYRIYRRDDKGRVVKKNDHLMDASHTSCVPGATWRAASLRTNRQIAATELAGGWAERARGLSRRGKRNCRREPGNAAAHTRKGARIAQRLCPGEQARKAGLGNALMRKICADADIAGHALFLMPDSERLSRWYSAHGSRRVQDDPGNRDAAQTAKSR